MELKVPTYLNSAKFFYNYLQVIPDYISMVAPYHPASWSQFGKCVKEVDVGTNMLAIVNIAVGKSEAASKQEVI